MTYALFAWEPYEARGGVGDLQCTGSLDECKAAFFEYVKAHLGDAFGEIADMADLSVIETAEVSADPTDLWRISWS